MPKKNKGGRKPGPKWTPAKQAFIDAMKKGTMNQTDCARLAYPKCKQPGAKACALLKDALVIKELDDFKRLKQIKDEEKAKTAGQKEGEAQAIERTDLIKEVAALARSAESESARVSAYALIAKMEGWIIQKHEDVTDRLKDKSADELNFIRIHRRDPASADELSDFVAAQKKIM